MRWATTTVFEVWNWKYEGINFDVTPHDHCKITQSIYYSNALFCFTVWVWVILPSSNKVKKLHLQLHCSTILVSQVQLTLVAA